MLPERGMKSDNSPPHERHVFRSSPTFVGRCGACHMHLAASSSDRALHALVNRLHSPCRPHESKLACLPSLVRLPSVLHLLPVLGSDPVIHVLEYEQVVACCV